MSMVIHHSGEWPADNWGEIMSDDAGSARPEEGEKLAAAELGAAAGGDTTSIACYFQKGNDVTWYWGLNNDNSWYSLNGSWATTPYTKLQKFFTGTSFSEIIAAANNAKAYYSLDGYGLIAVFAASKSAGYNYPIVSGDTELFPKS
jgi:hypothetical protein